MSQAVDVELVSKIESAAEKALNRLFAEHNESFYYITLVTFGECVCPFISAWSFEALEKEAEKSENVEQAKYDLKWDYAASPYCSFGYEDFFGELREVYEQRTSMLDDNDAYELEMDIRLNSMEQAMHDLDQKGLFGQGEKRSRIVINAEYMPPDNDNVERAKRLNPEASLKEWLEVFAEDNDEEPKKIDWDEIHNPDLCNVVLTKTLTDKRLAVRLRRDFASPLTLSDFLNSCSNIPFVIRSDFVYKKAKKILDDNQDYEGLIRIELTKNKK